MSDTPYIGFTNATLNAQPELRDGDSVNCPHCGGTHVVKDSTPPMLLSFRCGDKTYLAAVSGRSVVGVKADVSGKVDL